MYDQRWSLKGSERRSITDALEQVFHSANGWRKSIYSSKKERLRCCEYRDRESKIRRKVRTGLSEDKRLSGKLQRDSESAPRRN